MKLNFTEKQHIDKENNNLENEIESLFKKKVKTPKDTHHKESGCL